MRAESQTTHYKPKLNLITRGLNDLIEGNTGADINKRAICNATKFSTFCSSIILARAHVWQRLLP